MPSPTTRALRLVSADVEGVEPADAAPSLDALLRQIGAGDEAALEALYCQTVDHVYALGAKILGGGPDTEEVTEDVYLYAWNNAGRYDAHKGSPLAWLLTLARSRAIDRYRHRARQQRLGDALRAEPANDEAEPAPLTLFYGTRLSAMLEALPAPQREILTLAYFRGYTQSEIAEVLNLSLGTVKTHVRRTLQALRAELDG